MRRRRRTQPTILQELPPGQGPKLHLFQRHDLPIRWMERLDDDRDDDSGMQGYVFRAQIGTQQYAIKVFKFFDPWSTEYYWGPLMGEDTPLDIAAYCTDPFFAECRAYGQIQDGIKKRKVGSRVAVTCHGFLFLKEEDEKLLEDRGVDLGLDDVDLDFQQSMVGGCRARAIVKDLALGDSGVNQKNIKRILQGIKSLNKLKIYNLDIRADNYRNGQIVDFGSSWTEPHGLLNALDMEAAQEKKLADLANFDDMVEENDIETDARGLPNVDFCKRLRSWNK